MLLSALQCTVRGHIMDISVLVACLISLFGVSFLTYFTKSVYWEDQRLRYVINLLWFLEIFIWVSLVMLWG